MQLRKEKQEHALATAQAVLARNKKQNKRSKESPRRRKDVGELSRYLACGLEDPRALRPAESFRTRSYNRARQVEELIEHLFVQYPAPRFLLRGMLNRHGRLLVLGEDTAKIPALSAKAIGDWERKLFIAAAQGKSVSKLMSSLLNGREVHWFLLGPDHFDALHNLVWARMVACGVPQSMATRLTPRLVSERLWEKLGARKNEFVSMLAGFQHPVPQAILGEVMDFALNMIDEPRFRFKGRTLGSMRKLSREWHQLNRHGGRGELVFWPRAYSPWECITQDEHVRVVELNTNWMLHAETAKQRHCVFNYSRSCISGNHRIVSFRWLVRDAGGSLVETKRLTASVATKDRLVEQALGKRNRALDAAERRWAKQWASAHCLSVADYIWW